jgi:hypothetical protein
MEKPTRICVVCGNWFIPDDDDPEDICLTCFWGENTIL